MTRYGLYGAHSRDFLTYAGRILTHQSRAELEFLFPGTRVLELPSRIPPEQTLPVTAHPELSSVRFPLRKGDF